MPSEFLNDHRSAYHCMEYMGCFLGEGSDMIMDSCLESTILTALCGALLPKLISGAVRTSNVSMGMLRPAGLLVHHSPSLVFAFVPAPSHTAVSLSPREDRVRGPLSS